MAPHCWRPPPSSSSPPCQPSASPQLLPPLFDELQVEAGECCHHRRVLVLCFEAIAGLLAWLSQGAASAGNGRQRWPVRRSGHLGSVGVAVGGVNGHRRWRTERGGRNMQWGRNLRGVKIGAGNRDK
jgi:hypothetical protein